MAQAPQRAPVHARKRALHTGRVARQEFRGRQQVVRQRGRLRRLRVGVGRHHRLQVPRRQIQQHGTQRRQGLAEFQQLEPRRHAEERDRDIVAAARRVHLAGQLAARLFEQALDKEEEILAGAVVTGAGDLRAVQPVERRHQRGFLRRREDPLVRQHAGVGVVNLDQGVQKVLLGVFEIGAEDGLGIYGSREFFHHFAAANAGFLPRLTRFARMR